MGKMISRWIHNENNQLDKKKKKDIKKINRKQHNFNMQQNKVKQHSEVKEAAHSNKPAENHYSAALHSLTQLYSAFKLTKW